MRVCVAYLPPADPRNLTVCGVPADHGVHQGKFEAMSHEYLEGEIPYMRSDGDLELLENLLLGNRTVALPSLETILAHGIPALCKEIRSLRDAVQSWWRKE